MGPPLQLDVLDILPRGTAVKHCLSADDDDDFRTQKLGDVLRDRIGVRLRVLQNIHLDELVRLERLGERIQKVLGDAALADLRDGR